MKRLIIFLALLNTSLIISQSLDDYTTTNYISLAVPIAYEGELKYLDTSDMMVIKDLTQIKHNMSLLNSFPNLVSSVTIYEKDQGGSLSLLGHNLSSKNTSYLLIYDFTQTQTIEYEDNATNQVYSVLVGVSVRMIANVTTKKKGINLVDLFGLGIRAEKKTVQGSLEVRCNGATSQKINQMVPVTSDFSKSSIANALQSVATIKSHIYDVETKITPQILAFSVNGQKSDISTKFDFSIINNELKTYTF